MALSKDPEKRERQLAALRKHAFKPGDIGNPTGYNGRPFGERLKASATPEFVEAFVNGLKAAVERGEPWAFNIWLDRVDGPVPKEVKADVKQSGETKVVVEHVNDWRKAE